MKTGIQLIDRERNWQLEEHKKSIKHDVEQNNGFQLSDAAGVLCPNDRHSLEADECCPYGWDEAWWERMFNKPYKERLIIAGALIAAELDRLNATES